MLNPVKVRIAVNYRLQDFTRFFPLFSLVKVGDYKEFSSEKNFLAPERKRKRGVQNAYAQEAGT